MKILVCVKSVPSPESRFRINASGTGYDESGLTFHVNEYDLYAMEEAARIKERFGDVSITVVSVGPPRVVEQVRKAMGLGAEEGAVIDDSEAPAGDALAAAALLANWARAERYDLVLCGVMSENMQRGATGPMLAELLHLPCATTVIAERIEDGRKSILCERELEGGVRERVRLPLPALITVQSGINAPRYASLSNVLRAKGREVPVIKAAELGGAARRSEAVRRAYLHKRSGACEILTGDLDTMAEKLAERIRARVPR
ncbi:MAG TPA: electron transfer flavoprotein subunit beta/FixA family protein [bacterium]|nr:electron transfer flavoprotein subunit beta/FixA family protein [bacterium]